MEWKERDGWMLNPNLDWPQANTATQGSPPQTTDALKSRKKIRFPPCHAVIGISPNLHKLGTTVHHSTCGTVPHNTADTCISLQLSTKARLPYVEKKRLRDKLEEIQQVKQLDEWKCPVDIFTAVLEGLDDKDS